MEQFARAPVAGLGKWWRVSVGQEKTVSQDRHLYFIHDVYLQLTNVSWTTEEKPISIVPYLLLKITCEIES
ncbi:hypothetical protein DPMN_062163 [Dreissena polymorpha]|uniref:Uncharacterized protein n=1 Tax=Dreissena polymorpha TaxID=45954 RepID=A0A9D4HJX9_DREPO|nr:hypothetical protein DPMN_062163 [Dreissena polymorpha]